MTKLKDAIISRSNYTIKKKHKTNINSTVYERDYMTTTNNGGWDSDVIPYGEGNFKMIRSTNYDTAQRKFNNSDWVDNNGNEQWTESNISKVNKSDSSSESILKIKECFSGLRDFCYFGSAYELVKTTINNILLKFPGELYVTSDTFIFGDGVLGTEKFSDSNETPVIIYNPFKIDIFHEMVSTSEKTNGYNPLRYFCENRAHYVIYDNNDKLRNCDLIKWDVKLESVMDKPMCLVDGDLCATVEIYEELEVIDDITDIETTPNSKSFIIYVYYIGGEFVYITSSYWSGFHVRPDKVSCLNFKNEIGMFGSFLMNTKSNPIYTCTMSVIEEHDREYVKTKRRFTWPTYGGWNIMTSGGLYSNYVNDLLNVAEYYDNIYTDNLWRMMVHDSIKNMDKTYTNASKNEDYSDFSIGFGNVRGILLAIARLYDDIKLYIDNIKNVNNITYNSINNLSDYLLTDSNEISGWECYCPTKYLDDEKVGDLFLGETHEYTLSETNIRFYSNLKLNSKAILSRKGTRESIDMMLGLFGFKSYEFARKLYQKSPITEWEIDESGSPIEWDNLPFNKKSKYFDYKLDEYVAVAKNKSSDIINENEELPVEKYGKYVPQTDDEGLVLPAKTVTLIKEDNNGNTIKLKYLIPWFENGVVPDMYFQMYGGWDKIDAKVFKDNIIIESNDNIKIYDETVQYLKITNSLTTLLQISKSKLSNGVIYYVVNIDDVFEKVGNVTVDTASHYFVLNNVEYSGEFSSNGWQCITNEEIETQVKKDVRTNSVTTSYNAMKVIYLESIINNIKGNNPHTGHGKYDEGQEFLNYFKQLLKYYIDNDLFMDDAYDCTTGKLISEITKIGFEIDGLTEDNMKVWYFSDNKQETSDVLFKIPYDGYYNNGKSKTPNVGLKAYKNGDTTFETKLNAFNFETQNEGDNDEAAANSIINVKNLHLKFVNNVDDIYQYRKYLSETVLPYVKQVIPSTTILNTSIGEFEAYDYDAICFIYPELAGYSEEPGILDTINEELNEKIGFDSKDFNTTFIGDGSSDKTV